MRKWPLGILTPVLLLGAGLTVPSSKPCAYASHLAADSLLAKGSLAMSLPGTQRVELDRSGACLRVEVRTAGTARLVGLLLRGLDVPAEAVWLQVVS